MYFWRSVLLFLLVLIGNGVQPSRAQKTAPERCATGVHAILIRGQGDGDHLNVMVTMQSLVLQLIPGSSSVGLPYHHELNDHRVVAAEGALLMQQYIRDYVASCPKSKIFIMGYSLGGIVMMDGLCGTSSLWLSHIPAIEPAYNRNVIVAAAYGEETFMPQMPWDVGTCTDGVGNFTDVWNDPKLYPRLHPEWCDPFQNSLRSYCDRGDIGCCFKIPPEDNGAHLRYIFEYNMDLLHFVQRRINETGPL